jgi:phage shock protein C
MFCTHCGIQLGDPEPNFCASCGKATSAGQARYDRPYGRRLERPIEGRRVAGVCAGFANYMAVDVTLIRVLAVIGLFFSFGTGLIAYVIAALIIPNEERLPAGAPVRP